MVRFPGAELFAATALGAALALPAAAQGGWRAWDLYLRDGSRVVANPLGAPDDSRLAISVGGMEGHDKTVARRRIALVAAPTTVGPRREPIPGESLPPRPKGRVCADVVVRRDGRKTTGHVSLTRVEYSAGIVTQRGVDIALDSIAYIQFAEPRAAKCKPPMHAHARKSTP
jgi:hypothetical protein